MPYTGGGWTPGGGLGGLAGLSAVYPGMLQTEQQQNVLDEYAHQVKGKELFGNTLKMLAGQTSQAPPGQPLTYPQGGGAGPTSPQGQLPPGQMPYAGPPQGAPGAPQPPPMRPPMMTPMPGQPGAPGGIPQQPLRPPGAIPPQASGGPGRGVVESAGPTGGPLGGLAARGQLDIKTAAQYIARANPNASPRDIVEALNQAMPYLKAEEQMQLAQLRLDMQQQIQATREESLKERERHDVAIEGQSAERIGQADKRIAQKNEQLEQRKLEHQDKVAHWAFNQDMALKNHALKQLQLEERARATGRKEDIEAAKAEFNAGRELARLKIQEHSFMTDMTPEEKKSMEKDMDRVYQGYVDKLKKMGGGTAPSSPMPVPPATGGTPGQRTLLTPAQNEWFTAQSKGWTPEQRAKVISDLKEAGYDTSGL